MKAVAIALVAMSATSTLAFAQDAYIVDEDDTYVDSPDLYADPDPDLAVGTRVYGWTETRPDDCGTFKYWNGDYCADARFEPPRTEPLE